MAKWLNKYFSLGSNKTKSPPQPPWRDYREKCNGAGSADLLCAYRAQKDLDFEDPYSGPGSSLCKLHTMCHPDYSMPEHLGKAAPKAFSSSYFPVFQVLIADDYSDPFDAKSELNRMGKGENTGYMEPYEKQEGMKSHQKNMQLYDTPYEPEGSGVESNSESVMIHHLRESKLPQDDDRPADEYDQPWEWNKVTIPRRQLRAPGGGFKHNKHDSPEFCGILGERIDPTIQLEKQMSNQGFMHMKLMKTKEKYILGQNSPPFNSVPEVIHYYTTKKLPIKGAEHLSLLYPVAVRTL
uniref:SH2 domain-containing adapter protein B n=1 Tax=Strix occidentalis caurina TaxID=311401 RepID=A0A8D0F8B6_STROC